MFMSRPAEVRRPVRSGVRQDVRRGVPSPEGGLRGRVHVSRFRLQPVEACAQSKKHVQVQKPIATSVETARAMIETAKKGGIVLGVVSQHRFDDSSRFLAKAIAAGRLGKLLQCDCYVKWYRSATYYSRPIKGSWATEGGGALINQAIHQLDILRWLAGPLKELFGYWQWARCTRSSRKM